MPPQELQSVDDAAPISNRLEHVSFEEFLSPARRRIGEIMRTISIPLTDPEELAQARRLLAAEGYVDLGMFKEADGELRQLAPRWFNFEQTLRVQLHVYAGLGEWRKARALAKVLRDQSA